VEAKVTTNRLMLNTLRHFRISVPAFLLSCAALACAQPRTFELDPAQTQVAFTLGDVLHTVHGNFHLKRGSIQFDDSTGEASGELVVDALSGESGNSSRDKKMHKENLESAKYSEIVFTPRHIKGAVAAEGKSQVTIDGLLVLHGQSHPVTLTIDVQLHGGAGSADTAFVVPYEKWGVKNPSTFILRVSDKVEINVHAAGRLAPAATTPGPR
jgi:polyisoprenoid-binding protein YceI